MTPWQLLTVLNVVGLVGLIIWRVGAYEGRPGWAWSQRRWLLISLAVFTVVALGGCDSGHAGKNAAAPASSKASSTAGPSPTPTTSGPSPSPASTGTTGVCVTSAAKGSCGPYRYMAITNSDGQNTFVGQDVWNPIPGWSQTLRATGPGNWSVTANMPAGNTAVVSFPNTGQQYYYTNTLKDFSSIYSSFAEDMHATSGTSAWGAYDIWLNNWKNEVMIQHDFAGNGPCPAVATATFGGSGGVPVRDWNLCKYGSELIWKLTGGNARSGTLDILSMLTWLENHGYLPHGSGLVDISYGFEICSTGGKPEEFTLSDFSIRAAS